MLQILCLVYKLDDCFWFWQHAYHTCQNEWVIIVVEGPVS